MYKSAKQKPMDSTLINSRLGSDTKYLYEAVLHFVPEPSIEKALKIR